mgnify:CR=1 FL=1
MSKKIEKLFKSYRDQLLHLAKLYGVVEIKSYARSAKKLTISQLELVLIKNDIKSPKRWVNGSIGIVTDLTANSIDLKSEKELLNQLSIVTIRDSLKSVLPLLMCVMLLGCMLKQLRIPI